MEKLVKVAVDAMGGDHAPGEVVKGAVDAVNEKNNLKVFLVGKAPRIHEELSKYQYKNEQIEVVNAEEEISCDESPVEAIRKKKDSSMVVALKMVKEQKADAFVSSGSTGAVLYLSSRLVAGPGTGTAGNGSFPGTGLYVQSDGFCQKQEKPVEMVEAGRA